MARLVVVDARSIVDLLVNGAWALEVLEAIFGRSLAAPAHVDVDVVSILAGLNTSEVPATDIRMRVEVYLRMPLKRHDVSPLMLDALQVFDGLDAGDCHRGLCVNDALYVALANHLEVPLVTRSPALAAACSQAILVQASRGWGGV